MSIYENLTTFAGRPVQDWDAKVRIDNPSGLAYRIALSYDDAEEGAAWADRLAILEQNPRAGQIEALVIGAWGQVASGDSSAPVVEALAAARKQLGGLRYLFFGDITSEESEISWIVQSDLSPLFEAYPNLEHLTVRGGQALGLGKPRHAKLRELVIQAGGLPRTVIHEIASAEFPALEHLELWLGEKNYGGDATAQDVAALLTGDHLPRLKYLGLKNSEIQDEVAAAVAIAPILARLQTLDLSMGTLSDAGAKALLESPSIRGLKKLDIHHHFVSDEIVARVVALGIEVDASDKQAPHVWRGEESRFIEVGE